MKRLFSFVVAVLFCCTSTASFAYEAECLNSTGKFSDCKVTIADGTMQIAFNSKKWKELDRTISGDKITALSGGEYARRRVAESVATAVIFAPVFLFMLFAKKKRDNFGIEYVTDSGAKDSVMIQLKKKYGFPFGQQLQTISGKTIVYEGKADGKAADTGESKKGSKKITPSVQPETTGATSAASTDDSGSENLKKPRGNKYSR